MVIKGNGAVNTMEAVKINTKENGILTRVKQEKEEFHKYIIPQNMVDKITILIDLSLS